jgi:hypothetical protein
MSLTDLIDDKAKAAAQERDLWAGEIFGAPDTEAKTVAVIVMGKHASKPYRDVPYTPHPGPDHPSDGGRCLVGFDDDDRPWVIAWRP